ncbi:MAG: HPF/RaiA family ribosome-associated protein [Actinomycetota bacterium]
MELRVIAPDDNLKDQDIDRIEKDLEKIDRRLESYDLVRAEVRIAQNGGPSKAVTLELHYGRQHLLAKAEHAKIGQAVRAARDDILRQINDRSRGGHSSFTKGR